VVLLIAACESSSDETPTSLATSSPIPTITAAPPASVGGLAVPSTHRVGSAYPDGVESLRDLIGLGLVLPQGDPLGLDDVVRALQAEGWEVRGLAPTWVNCGVLIPSALLVTREDGAARAVDILVYADAHELEHQWTVAEDGSSLPRSGESCAASNTRLVQTFGGGVESQPIPPLASGRVANILAAVPPAYGQQDLDAAFTADVVGVIEGITVPGD
jgi:hypothetical protein